MNQDAPWETHHPTNPAMSGQAHMFDPSQFHSGFGPPQSEAGPQHMMNTNAAGPPSNVPMPMMTSEQPYMGQGQWKSEYQPMYDPTQAGPHMNQGNWSNPQQQGHYPEQNAWANQAPLSPGSAQVQAVSDQLHNGYCYGMEMQGGQQMPPQHVPSQQMSPQHMPSQQMSPQHMPPQHMPPVSDASHLQQYQAPSNGHVLPPIIGSEPPASSVYNDGSSEGMVAFFGGADDGAVVYPAAGPPADVPPSAPMDNVPLDDSATSSDGRAGTRLPKLFSSDSFSNLPLEPSSFDTTQSGSDPFDAVGSDRSAEHDSLPNQTPQGVEAETARSDGHVHAHFLTTEEHADPGHAHHSRHSSCGDRVNFLIGGSASTSGNQSPFNFGHPGEDAAGCHGDDATDPHHHSNLAISALPNPHGGEIPEPQFDHLAQRPGQPPPAEQQQPQPQDPPQQQGQSQRLPQPEHLPQPQQPHEHLQHLPQPQDLPLHLSQPPQRQDMPQPQNMPQPHDRSLPPQPQDMPQPQNLSQPPQPQYMPQLQDRSQPPREQPQHVPQPQDQSQPPRDQPQHVPQPQDQSQPPRDQPQHVPQPQDRSQPPRDQPQHVPQPQDQSQPPREQPQHMPQPQDQSQPPREQPQHVPQPQDRSQPPREQLQHVPQPQDRSQPPREQPQHVPQPQDRSQPPREQPQHLPQPIHQMPQEQPHHQLQPQTQQPQQIQPHQQPPLHERNMQPPQQQSAQPAQFPQNFQQPSQVLPEPAPLPQLPQQHLKSMQPHQLLDQSQIHGQQVNIRYDNQPRIQSPLGQQHGGTGRLDQSWSSNQPSLERNNPNMASGQSVARRRSSSSQHSVDANCSTGSTSSRFEPGFTQQTSPSSVTSIHDSIGSDGLRNQEVPLSPGLAPQQVMTPEDARPAQVTSPRSSGPLMTHTNSPFHALPPRRHHVSGGSSSASSSRGVEENQQVPQMAYSQLPLQVVPDLSEHVRPGETLPHTQATADAAVPRLSDSKGVIGRDKSLDDYEELTAYQKNRRTNESRSRCITPATATLWADNSLSAPLVVGMVLAPAMPLDASGASLLAPLSPPASCSYGTGTAPLSVVASGGIVNRMPVLSTVPLVINPQATFGVLPAGQVQPINVHPPGVVQPQPVRPNVHGPSTHSAFHSAAVPPQVPSIEPGSRHVSSEGGSESSGANRGQVANAMSSGGGVLIGDAQLPQVVPAVTSPPMSHVTTSVPTVQTQTFELEQQVPESGASVSSSRQSDYKRYPSSSTPGTEPRHADRARAYPDDRPSSRQQRYSDNRPDDQVRSRSRQQQYPDDGGRSRRGDHAEDRPSSRQGHQYDERSTSRQGHQYDERSTSRQGHQYDERSTSRQGQYDERSRSRQENPHSRPTSRQGSYPDERQGERSRGKSRQSQHVDERTRSRSRQRYYDEHAGQSYDRPHSRQDRYYQDDAARTKAYYDDRQGYEGGRYYGTEDRQHSSTGSTDVQDRSRQHHYYKDRQYKDYYNRYYDDYYKDKQSASYYDRDPYADRYSRGYYEELQASGQQPQQDPRYQKYYDYSQAAYQYYDQRSQHSQSRGSTPADAYYEQGSQHGHSRSTTPAHGYPGDAPTADRHGGYGSRPGSRQGEELIASPIYPAPDSSAALRYYDQSYSYAATPPEPVVEPKRLTPHKFCLPHMRASFGAAGLLVKVLPNQPCDGQPALVVIQDLADVIGEGRDVDELTAFPGPLIKGETHKNDVLMYCQKKARQCRDDETQVDRESAELLWKYLQLLIKQNGTVVGADIADLLLEGHEPSSLDYSRHGLRIGRSREDLLDDSSAVATTTGVNRSVIAGGGDLSVDDVTDRFRNLLLHGQKKDALEWAIKHSLWGHALFLASKMDQKTHASVMTRFANVSMKMNDPLQTLYQLMSGRQPAAVTLAMDEKWGDWRPHLAMILSNQSNKPDLDRKSIIILGDTLAAKGCLHASHFCYLMASVALTDCSRRSSKLVLIGSSHSLPFGEFANNTAIQCTEVYEFAQSLGNPLFVAISFQSFKMIYALRLLEAGLAEQALHYCEVIARTLLQNPQFYTSTLVALVYQFADRLKLYDPLRLQMGDDAVEDPDWLINLHRLHQAFQDGSMQTISGAQTPVMGIRNGSTATNSEVGDIMLYGQQHLSLANSGSVQTYAAVSQGGAVVPQIGASTDVVAGQDFSQYLPQQQPQPAWDQNQQSDPSQQTQQQQYDPTQQTQQWDPSQQAQQQPQWDPSQQQTLQQWDANSNNQQQQQFDPNQPQTLQQWDSSPQTQQWSQGQLDNGYPGYQGATTDATDAAPVATSPDDRLQGESGNTGEVPRALHSVDLGASMNSGVTTTTSATDEDDESHDSGAPPGFDYFGMTANPLEGEGDSFSDESSSCSSDKLVTARDMGPVDAVGAAPLLSGPANQFGKSAGSSLPLGASASNFEKPLGAPGEQTYPGEEESDQTGGGGPRKQTYPGEEDGHSDGKNFYNNKANKSWFGSFISKFARKNENEMKLPDDKNPAIVWDADRKRWVNTDGTEEDIDKPTAPPPKDSELTGDAPDGFCNSAVPMGGPPPAMGGPALGAGPPPPLNKFSLQRNRGARKQYVDVMAAGNPSKPSVAPLTNMFTNLPKSASMPANMFVPSVTAEQLGQVGEVQGSPDAATSDAQQLAQQSHLQSAATHDANAPGITPDQDLHLGANLEPSKAPSNHSRRSSVSSVSREVQSYMQPPPEMAQPPPPSSIPMMFNPAQFNQGAEQPAAPTSAVSQPHGPRYGQRRHYPK